MRFLRRLGLWRSNKAERNHKLKLNILRLLLPGMNAVVIEEYIRTRHQLTASHPALSTIMNEEFTRSSMSSLVDQLKKTDSKLSESELQQKIWQLLESDHQLSELRERITGLYIQSQDLQNVFKLFESRGIPQNICEIPFLCLPASSHITHHLSHSGHNLLAYRQLALEALLQKDSYLFLERSRVMFNTFKMSPIPLFVDLVYAIAQFINESMKRDYDADDVSEVPLHLIQLISSLRRQVMAYPQHLFILHTVEQVETWADQKYAHRSLVSVSHDREVSDLLQEPEDQVSDQVEETVQLSSGQNMKIETAEDQYLTVSSQSTTSPTYQQSSRSLDISWVLQRVSASSNSTVEQKNTRGTESVLPLASWRSKSLLLRKGDLESLWSSLLIGQGFASITLDSLHDLQVKTVDQLNHLIGRRGVPLLRNEAVRLLGSLGLRLPQVWEVQALYASGHLNSSSAFWTRDSRQHLWSPSEGRWRAQSQKLKVTLTAFWDEHTYTSQDLESEEYEAIDALIWLDSLASDTINAFDFGLSELVDLNLTPSADIFERSTAETQEYTVEINSEVDRLESLSEENILVEPEASSPELLSESLSEAVISVEPDDLSMEVGSESPSEEARPAESDGPSMKVVSDSPIAPGISVESEVDTRDQTWPSHVIESFGELSPEYLHIISEGSEELFQILLMIKKHQHILRKDLEIMTGCSSVRISLTLNKLKILIQKNNLELLVSQKFETSRTAPVTGTYYTWLG